MSLKNFVAIDLETANAYRHSICEIGITIVKNSKVVESKSWFVRPHNNEYDEFNIWIHGITPDMTKDSPSFSDVWNEVLPYLANSLVVAHNVSFDMYAIRDALVESGIAFPSFSFVCTYRLATYMLSQVEYGLYNYKLDSLCDCFKINIDGHHRAEADSLACAELFLKLIETANVGSLDELQSKYTFKCGTFSTETFCSQSRVRNYSGKGIDLSSIVGDESKFDTDSYFYGKSVCFTGTCQFGTRKNLLQKIADIGGTPMDSVTKKTDILVVGQQDFRVVGDSGMSGKQKKAAEMIKKGANIEILSEADFLSML